MLKELGGRDPLYKFVDPGILGDIYKPIVGWSTPSPELNIPSMADDAQQS